MCFPVLRDPMHRLFHVAAAGVVLASASACSGDGTGPREAPDLTLEVTAFPGQTYVVPTDNGPGAGCNIVFSLKPVGDAGATAAWTGGTLRFYAGADRTTPFDSLQLTAEEMNEEFGAGLRAGTPQSGTLSFLASVPYGLEAEFRYSVQGSGRAGSSKVYAPCTVSAEQDGGTPPAVTGLQVTVRPGLPVEAGDTVRVSWTASSTTGLWESGVVVTGAFEAQYRSGAPYQKTQAFATEFIVPRGALLGEPVRVHAFARDLLVRGSAPVSEAVGPVADVTPPVLLGASTTGVYGEPMRGEFESGLGIGVTVYAQDRGRLAYVVYETGPAGATVRDSVALDTVSIQRVGLPTRAGWSGAGELRLYVRDVAGNRSGTVQAAPGAIRFYPARQVASRETQIPYAPDEFAVDGARGLLVVSARDPLQRLYVYGLGDLAQVGVVNLAQPVVRVEFAPDGRAVALLGGLNGGMLAFVDVAGQRVDRYVTLDREVADSVYGFGMTSAGRALVVARRSGGASVVLEYDPATNTQRVRTDAPAIPGPEAGVATSLDRSRLLLGAGCVYRVDTDTFGPCVRLGPQGPYQGSGYTGSGTGAYWVGDGRVLDAGLRVVTGVQTGIGVLSADDRFVFEGGFDRIRRLRLAGGQVEDALVARMHGSARATADGRFLVGVTNGQTNTPFYLRVVELP